MSSRQPPTSRTVVVHGLLAGALGTAAMTAWQTLAAKLQGSGEDQSQADPPPDPWEQAPAPAKVAKRISEGVFQQEVSSELIPVLSNAMHWAYGTSWGIVYGLAVAGVARPTGRRGVMLGAIVWGGSYIQLVPMGIYEPPWKYRPQELALDLSYHVAYGLGTAFAFKAIER